MLLNQTTTASTTTSLLEIIRVILDENNENYSVDLMNATDSEETIFWKFSNAYRPIHGWLSTAVCLFGIPSNLLNIIVLTRPNMITSPTNLILTALAFSDLFTMLSSIVFGIFFYIVHIDKPLYEPSLTRDSWAWTYFAMLHVMASVTFHSISIWLTVYLACFRYIYLASSSSAVCGAIHQTSTGYRNPRSSSTTSSMLAATTNTRDRGSSSAVRARERLLSARSRMAYIFHRCLLQCRTYNCTLVGILNICIFCVLFCVPAYMFPSVKRFEYSNETLVELVSEPENAGRRLINKTTHRVQYYYQVKQSELNERTNNIVFKITFYSQAILGKFIPCILLVTFSALLIHSLVVINRNNKRLNRSSAIGKKKPIAKPSLAQRLLAVVGFKKPSNLAESNHQNQQNTYRQRKMTKTSINNSDLIGNVDMIAMKKSVSLQVPERLIVPIDPSSTSSHMTAMTTPMTPGAPRSSTVAVPSSPTLQVNRAASTSTSALSLATRRLSDIRLNKFFPSTSSSSNNRVPVTIELEDDDVPVKLPPRLSANTNKFTKNKQNEKRKFHPVSNPTVVKPKRNKTKENLRTTLMLIIVCILFLITEFPQAILILFSIIYGDPFSHDSFYYRVYTPLGDLLDMLALINNSINFLLYCTMSRAFRNTFYTLIMRFSCCALFLSPCMPKEARDAQAQIKSKRQGRKPVNKKSDVNTHLEENNNINALVNSNNFSIFTGNTGINNGAKENDGGLATETAMQSVAIAKLNEAVDNIELKPLIKN